MSEDEKVKRCIQCNKIIVGDSLLGLCPKCADKDARGGAGCALVIGGLVLIVKKAWKPTAQFLKGVINAITKT